MSAVVPDREGGDLVRRIARGDREAEEELFSRYGTGIRFLLGRWCRDRATAEDLHQETLRLALQKIRQGEVREPERITAFLYGLAKNLSLQLYRSAGYRRRGEPLAETEALPDRQASPLAELLRRERAARIRQVLSEMGSERDREVLVRFYLAEESTERICADLDLAPAHFYRVLYRARERYRKLFGERSEPLRA
jgi:RNA polymerase sigma-70 factor (ECF subfamily)